MINWLRLIPSSSPIFSGNTSFQRTALSPIGFMSVVASFLLTMTLLISGRSGGGNGTDGLAAGTSGCSNHKACPPVNNGSLSSNTDVVTITANIMDGIDIKRPAATAIGAQATPSAEEDASATEQMTFDDVQREARQKWYAEMREAPEVGLRLHALDVWAEHPNDGINPLTDALVDADESVRTRAQELYSQYFPGGEAAAQSIQEDPVASDAQEPYTPPMQGEEVEAQFIQEDQVAGDAQEPYTPPMQGEEVEAQFIQEDPVASDVQEPYTPPMLGEETAAQFIQEDSVVSEPENPGVPSSFVP